MTTNEILDRAVAARTGIATCTEAERNRGLRSMADSLEAHTDAILEANRLDLQAAQNTVSPVMLDRLSLDPRRICAMAQGIRDVIDLPDPLGQILDAYDAPNGLHIRKISVPIGVLAIIYESRPNVTSDAAALSVKSGNVCVLRGGKEAIHSNIAILNALRQGLLAAGLPEDSVCLVTDTSRHSATELMTAVGKVDVLIPRGGAGLIRSCVENAKVPCIQTGTGICHIYVDETADFEKALAIVENAKVSRPSVCNAAEVCLVHHTIAPAFLPLLRQRLTPRVLLKLDPLAAQIIPGEAAGAHDFDTEFLDYILAVKVVEDVADAVAHIRAHSTGHSEAILTETKETAAYFTSQVDSAAVYVNASTRFTDGGEFGLGCEIGISTQKLHARGPMGLQALTSYKYIIEGSGQIR